METVRCCLCGAITYLPAPAGWESLTLGSTTRVFCPQCGQGVASDLSAALEQASKGLHELLEQDEAN